MNIEKTISEHAVSDILTPMLESQDRIVTEDVAPLFDRATGLDTPPASGTVTTTIEESRSVITAIIRKAWTATLTMLCGASVIGYITAAYTYLRTRLQGNETYGIPDRRSEISASSPLAANLALLNDRKIGGADVPDGMSIIHLLGDSSVYNDVTELIDSTHGWTYNRNSLAQFPNAKKVSLGCKTATINIVANNSVIEELNIDELESLPAGNSSNFFNALTKLKHFSAPKLKIMSSGQSANLCALTECEDIYLPEWTGTINVHVAGYFCNCPALKEVYAPNLTGISGFRYNGGNMIGFCVNDPLLEKVVLGALTEFSYSYGQSGNDANLAFYQCPKLIHLELGAGTKTSMYIAAWNPDLTDSDVKAMFLSNFRSYIANRLTDNGSGKTLTLSQAVFSEIWDSQGQPQVKGDGLDDLRADIHRIVRTRKQWAVNKA
jgi:hypothetical protein